MKRSPFRRARIVWAVLLGVGLNGCEDEQGQQARQAPPVVRTAPVTAGEATDYFRTVGEVVTAERVELSPEVAGRVEEVLVADGAEVAAGENLIRLDSATERAELAAARARLAERGEDLERARTLRRQGYETEANVQLAEAELEQAQAGVQRAQAELDDHLLKAPFAGRIGFVRVSPGDYVSPGQTLLSLAQTSEPRLRFTVPQSLHEVLADARSVQVSRPGDGSPMPAPIVAVSRLAEVETRSFEVEAALPENSSLLPGSFALVDLPTGTRAEALFVPEPAIQREAASAYVYRVGQDDVAQRVQVTVGVFRQDKVEIRGPLEAGDRVVVAGMQRIADGTKVRVELTQAGGPRSDAPARDSD